MGLHFKITSNMAKRVFFEFLPFNNMKECLQWAVYKSWWFGVVIIFKILETIVLSWVLFCKKCPLFLGRLKWNYFQVAVKCFAMPNCFISSKDFKLFKVTKHFLSFQELFFIFLMISTYNTWAKWNCNISHQCFHHYSCFEDIIQVWCFLH